MEVLVLEYVTDGYKTARPELKYDVSCYPPPPPPPLSPGMS